MNSWESIPTIVFSRAIALRSCLRHPPICPFQGCHHAATLKRNGILWLLHASQAPGTTGMRQPFFAKEIHFPVSEIQLFPALA